VRRAVAATMILAGVALAGCESSQHKSARLERTGAASIKGQRGLSITRRAAGVTVAERAVVHDANGAAVALVLRNTRPQPLADVPIAIDVRGASGASVFRNDDAGLDRSLVSLALLPGQGSAVWVNDQVQADATPRRVRAEVGTPKARRIPARLPAISLTRPTLEADPASGVEAVGWATLRSGPQQRDLVVFCLARRRGRIVAAGRAIVPRLTSRKRVRFHLFFIGDPRRARLTLSAPPTVL
jgi:hypothetical protein